MTIQEKLRTRKPAYVPTDAQQRLIAAWFAEHPDETSAYLFYDGRLESFASMQTRMSSRTAQLVSIATEGFPVIVSRHHL